jgi:CheY-like chemotaxis protein
MLRVLLMDRGLLVVHAQNLRQALDIVEQPIAAAILDITLAEANVYPVAERLRASRGGGLPDRSGFQGRAAGAQALPDRSPTASPAPATT